MKKVIDLSHLDKIREEKDKYQLGCYKGYTFDNSFICGLDKEDGWNVYIGNPSYECNRIKRFKTLEEIKNYIDRTVGE